METQRMAWVVVALAGLGIAGPASACCPTGTGGFADSGLGESNPPAPDLSPAADWQVYGFERSGIRHLQVNGAGAIRFAIGYIGETIWVVPIGTDADRVRLPGEWMPSGNGEVVYAGDLAITRYATAGGDVWAVELTDR